MKWKELKWDFKKAPINDVQVNKVADLLKIRFPKDYVECIKLFHGASPSPNNFKFNDNIGEMGSCVSFFLDFIDGSQDNIVKMYHLIQDQLPTGVIPIAQDPGGDFICFQYANGNDPKIVYWHHERYGNDSISKLADNFTKFIEMLCEE